MSIPSSQSVYQVPCSKRIFSLKPSEVTTHVVLDLRTRVCRDLLDVSVGAHCCHDQETDQSNYRRDPFRNIIKVSHDCGMLGSIQAHVDNTRAITDDRSP